MVPELLSAQEQGTSLTLVAFRQGCAIGLGELVLTEPPELRNLGVLPREQGHGAGTALITAAEHRAISSGHLAITIAVSVDNPDARRLYERRGYRATGETRTVTYDYLADEGTTRTATETSEVLVKRLLAVDNERAGGNA